jgi:RNA ligase (TIGR02306 family)
MASTLVAPVVKIDNVREHPNADRLEIVEVLGYQLVVPRGCYVEGEKAIYIPADSIVPPVMAEKWGVVNYLKGKDKNRVGKVRLRGEPSFGLLVGMPEGENLEIGFDTSEMFGLMKYEPPIRPMQGDQAPYDADIDPYFDKYTDIENGLIFTDVFKEGEEVAVTEKVHGSNCRLAIVRGVEVAGSMEVRRKRPETEDEMQKSTYWFPWTILAVKRMLQLHYLAVGGQRDVILYGEVYGGSVQSLHYGIPKGKGFGFRAFDLSVGGKYVDYPEFVSLCDRYGVERVPEIFCGEFNFKRIKAIANGGTLLDGEHIREGIVVKPLKERTDPKVGRAILKYISTEYSLSKQSDFKDV